MYVVSIYPSPAFPVDELMRSNLLSNESRCFPSSMNGLMLHAKVGWKDPLTDQQNPLNQNIISN